MEDYLNQQARKASFSFNQVAQFLLVLLVSKFLKSIGIYLCYDLLKHIHIVELLFYASLTASVIFVLLQKPFSNVSTSNPQQQANNKRLNKFQYLRIFKYSFIQTFIKVLWLFGLTQCGPLRTTLIFEQSEFVILFALKAVFLSQTTPSRTRAVVMLIAATLILLAFDNDDSLNVMNSQEKSHPEGSHHGILAHIFYFIISWFDVTDHKAGVLLLVLALLLQTGFNNSSMSKVLVSDIGGTKRLRALSTCFSTLLLAPWAFFNLFSSVCYFNLKKITLKSENFNFK